jgi:N-acetylneuraminate synthase
MVALELSPFHELFVLELANNHWGRLDRGLRIVHEFAKVVRRHGVRAAIKLQFREVDDFIHRDFRDRQDIRYIQKTLATQMSWADYRTLVEEIRNQGMITMVTPFDEKSIERCVDMDVDVLKIASSDLNDWPLVAKMIATGKPAIVSTGGAALSDIDKLVHLYEEAGIPLAINHCVSLYPSEDDELEVNQIDFLKARYPHNVIGFSTHEYHDWSSSIMMAYAKGARTFERHVDIEEGGIPVSPYCSKPENVDEWFTAFRKAKQMCGGASTARRMLPEKEVRYLDALVRGYYAKRDLPPGTRVSAKDFYLAIPLQQGQLSCREAIDGATLERGVKAHAPLTLDHAAESLGLDAKTAGVIRARGLASTTAPAAVKPLHEVQAVAARRVRAARG